MEDQNNMSVQSIPAANAMILRHKMVPGSFSRGPAAASFLTPQGWVITPAHSVRTPAEAEWFSYVMGTSPLMQKRKILTMNGELLKIREAGKNNTYQLFIPGTQPRDSVVISRDTLDNIGPIQIDEEDVNKFVQEKLKLAQDKNCTYLLVYHNHFDHQTGDSILKAKPATSKGHYLKGVAISTTIGPGVKLDVTQFGGH